MSFKISVFQSLFLRYAMPNEGKGKCGPEFATVAVKREGEGTPAHNCLSPEVTHSNALCGPLARTMAPT